MDKSEFYTILIVILLVGVVLSDEAWVKGMLLVLQLICLVAFIIYRLVEE